MRKHHQWWRETFGSTWRVERSLLVSSMRAAGDERPPAQLKEAATVANHRADPYRKPAGPDVDFARSLYFAHLPRPPS